MPVFHTVFTSRIFWLSCGSVLALSACGGDSTSEDISSSTSSVSTAAVSAPTITSQPTSVTVASGDSATLTVVAAGTSLTYQWYLAGAAIANATAATYTASAAGSYYVVVTNTAGSVSSSTVTVAVTTLPVIATQPVSATIVTGTSATLSITASGDALAYQWYRNGTAVAGATGSSYVATEAGVYYVTVTNNAGSATSTSATLTVSATAIAPVITAQPASASVATGASTTFSVQASGTNNTYQWYFNGVAISGATATSYAIVSATAANSGTYYVIATNNAGTATSASVALVVTVASAGGNTAAVTTAANAFLATLSSTQKTVATSASSVSTVLFDYTRANAIVWSNLPGARHGLRLNSTTLTTEQLAAANSLITTALSAAGKAEMEEIRASDDVINAYNAAGGWGSGLYSIAFIGTPSATTPWLLQLTGHHLAYNITYNATQVSATPTFLGVEPPNWTVSSTGAYTVNNTASSSGTAHAPLEVQRAAVSALATALQADTTTATSTRLTSTYDDVIMGVTMGGGDSNYGSLAYPTSGRGALYSTLSDTQKAYVKTAIAAWVNTQASDIATTLLAAYTTDAALAATYVGYSPGQGGTADFGAFPNAQTTPLNAQRSYLRIDGPRVWIEFIVQQGVAYRNYVHYHSLWRDKTADYGASF